MSAVQYIPIGTAEFTKDLLDSNFAVFAAALLDNEKRLSALERNVTDLSEVLFDTTKTMVQVASKIKRRPSKLVLLGVVAGSVYVGYKYAEMVFDDRKPDVSQKKPANTKPTDPTQN